MNTVEYVVLPHMKGSLGLQVASISGLWYLPATEEKASRLRVTSPALSEAKSLGGADADTLWDAMRRRGADFLFTSHMGGTLAIPREQVRTAYYSEESGTPLLRLVFDADPSGKTLEGDEATRIWKELRHAELTTRD